MEFLKKQQYFWFYLIFSQPTNQLRLYLAKHADDKALLTKHIDPVIASIITFKIKLTKNLSIPINNTSPDNG